MACFSIASMAAIVLSKCGPFRGYASGRPTRFPNYSPATGAGNAPTLMGSEITEFHFPTMWPKKVGEPWAVFIFMECPASNCASTP